MKLKIKPGTKVFWDTYSGLIKAVYYCKAANKDITIKITAKNNKAYKCGEILTVLSLHVIPRECCHKTGLFTFGAYPDYEFI
jgi:hypothetical protein